MISHKNPNTPSEGKRNEEDFRGSDGSCFCVLGRGLRGRGGEGGSACDGPGSGEGGPDGGEEGVQAEGSPDHRHDRGDRRGGRHLHGEGQKGQRGPESRREGQAGRFQGRRQGRREACRWHRIVREGREGPEGEEGRSEAGGRAESRYEAGGEEVTRFIRVAVRPNKGFPWTHGRGD